MPEDIEMCPSCGSEEVYTKFGADPMTDRYYTDYLCCECDRSGRLYRLPSIIPEDFGTWDDNGVNLALAERNAIDPRGEEQ